MPAAQVVCVVCKQEVSKRSTLSLEILGGGQGRACRSHEMVKTLAQECAAAAQLRRQVSEMERRLRVMVIAAGLQVMCTATRRSPEFFYDRLRSAGYTPAMVDEIKKHVELTGGPVMTPEEFQGVVFASIVLAEKK